MFHALIMAGGSGTRLWPLSRKLMPKQALALLGDPDLPFLDEPTTGLDPQARHHFWQRIEAIKAQGKTVVLTTHYMDEAQQLCDRIAIVDHGHLLSLDTPAALLAQHFDGGLVRLAGPPALARLRSEGAVRDRCGRVLYGKVDGDAARPGIAIPLSPARTPTPQEGAPLHSEPLRQQRRRFRSRWNS